MIRILCIVSSMNAGGAETFLMKIYRRLDKSAYQMDFCVNTEEEGFYDAEIISMGGRIYHIPSKSKDIFKFSKQLHDIVCDNGYNNVMRITSNAMGFYDLHVAKKAGAMNCIARSSNSSDGGSLKTKSAHLLGKLLYKKSVDIEIAPSDLAAIYTFGEKDYRSGKVNILHNGVDFNEYKFSGEARKKMRAELEIDDGCFLMGHIGRFSAQKNHGFLIDVFRGVLDRYPNTRLLLVGEGKLEDEIKNKCKKYGIDERVIFAGVRKDIPNILSAMDLFVFPSLYEGMPNVLIEAQASGLKCLISDRITKDVLISDFVDMLSVDDPAAWVDETVSCISSHDSATDLREKVALPSEYDIKNVSEIFVSYLV